MCDANIWTYCNKTYSDPELIPKFGELVNWRSQPEKLPPVK